MDKLSYGEMAERPPAAPGPKPEDPDAEDETVVLRLTPIWSKI